MSNITYTVVKRRKKNISIYIKLDGSVVVSVPLFASEKRIKEVVENKQEWIIKNVLEMQKRKASIKEREFKEGDSFLYLGNEYYLQLIGDHKNKKPEISINLNKLELSLNNKFVHNKDVIKKYLYNWYRMKALKLIIERTEILANRTGLKPRSISIKEMKRSWGICKSNNDLSLNWRLIFAPIPIIDYVVLHELCHIKHHNHSKRFWMLVEEYMPDCKERRKWLKTNGERLTI